MRKSVAITFSVIGLLLCAVSCKKKFDLPAPPAPPAVSGYITIDSIFNRYATHYISASATKLYRFTGDVNLQCLVTADESSGNIYKTVFVEDSTGALTIKLMNAGGLAVGDMIRINLNNVVLNDYGGVVQLDSIDIEKRVAKISSGNPVTATKVTMNQIMTPNSLSMSPFQSRLVWLDSVEFISGDKSKPFADGVNKNSIDRTIINPYNKSIIVRSSGYANFANYLTPCGSGRMTAIVSEYNGDIQMILRDYSEVRFASGNCPLIVRTFNSGVDKDNSAAGSAGNWTTYNVSGSVNWVPGSYSGKEYLQISNYIGGSNFACESWLISPSINISGALNPRLNFLSAYKYTGPALEVLVSTNYNGGHPGLATWTSLNPTLSAGNFSWTTSGNISLVAFKSSNTTVAFKYTGTSSAGSTWEIDNIAVFGE